MNIEEDKKYLINLIKWYRDEYHKEDFGHSEFIENISKLTKSSELEPYYQIVDDWLDM